jgi:hypothetical protein
MPEVVEGVDLRHLDEVVLGRRRGRRPLDRAAVHGSASWVFGRREVTTRFPRNTRIESAIRNAPTDETWFQNVRPSDAG